MQLQSLTINILYTKRDGWSVIYVDERYFSEKEVMKTSYLALFMFKIIDLQAIDVYIDHTDANLRRNIARHSMTRVYIT